MNGCVAPSFIEESTCSVKMVEVVLVCLAAPEVQVCHFEIAPEMARCVTIGLVPVDRSTSAVGQESLSSVFVQILRMLSKELICFRPESWDRFWCIVESYSETVSFVVVVHVTEHVVVDVAKEVNVGFDTPIVLHIFQGRMLVE